MYLLLSLYHWLCLSRQKLLTTIYFVEVMIKINKELVQKLIKDQFLEYASLLICQVEKSGHDNRTFHLGDKMTIRLPSGKDYISQAEKESF